MAHGVAAGDGLAVDAVHQSLIHARGVGGRPELEVGVGGEGLAVADALLGVGGEIGVVIHYLLGGCESLVEEEVYLGGIVVGEVLEVLGLCAGPAGVAVGHEGSAGKVPLKGSLVEGHAGLEEQGSVAGDAHAAADGRAVAEHLDGLVEVAEDEAGHHVAGLALGSLDEDGLVKRQGLGDDGIVAQGLELAEVLHGAEHVSLADVVLGGDGVAGDLAGLILGQRLLQEEVEVVDVAEAP